MTITSQFANMTSLSNFLDVAVISYGPSFMSISLLVLELWLTRNPEIGYTPVWILPNIWRLGRIRDTKVCTNVCNEMLLNATKYQGLQLLVWVIKWKPTVGKLTNPLTQIKVNLCFNNKLPKVDSNLLNRYFVLNFFSDKRFLK